MFPPWCYPERVFIEPSSAVSEPEEVVVVSIMNSADGLGNGHDFSWNDVMEIRLILWVWLGENWKGINRGVRTG